jgi:predicted enzyme related to lactoylglutathione lyase
VDDIDETLERLRARGAQLVGEVVQYKDAYRLDLPPKKWTGLSCF